MLQEGDVLGRFKLLRLLGRGGFGVVFEAEDVLVKERVAIKALHPALASDTQVRERFRRELQLTRRITHPAVCRVHDLHEEGDVLFISMQLVDGRTLVDLIRKDELTPLRVVRIARQVCAALSAAHAEGVIHRDLKPANILVGEGDRVTVLDFGIATAAGSTHLTQPGEALGSMAYLPPEVWEGDPATARGDQYSLAVTVFAALTRTLPYPGKTPDDIVTAQKLTHPTLREHDAEIDADLEWAVLKAMSIDPTSRFSSVAAFDDALTRVESKLGGDVAPALPSPPSTSPLLAPRSSTVAIETASATVPLPVVDGAPTQSGMRLRGVLVGVAAAVAVAAVGVSAGLARTATRSEPDAGAAIVTAVPVAPKPPAPTTTPPEAPAPAPVPEARDAARKAAQAAVVRLAADARTKGIRTGDVAGLDDALDDARRAAAKGSTDDASRSLRVARDALDGVVIDRAFVSAKLARFNRAYAAVTDPARKARLSPINTDVVARIAKGDWLGANARLNEAFALLSR